MSWYFKQRQKDAKLYIEFYYLKLRQNKLYIRDHSSDLNIAIISAIFYYLCFTCCNKILAERYRRI